MDCVKEAVDAVGLTSYILSLEQGYETMLMPGARNVSRVISSKILLARCIVAKPQLLCIVESFRFLEEREYARLVHFLTDKKKSWTLLAISDDVHFASQCDRIVVMKDGRIQDDLTYEELTKTSYFEHLFKIN
jgi:ABC-type multidrug transport system fused ATPase/permease subunit